MNIVTDFGAVGDGVTDNYTAFKAAVTALKAAGGGCLYIPAGVYILSRKTLPSGIAGVFDISGLNNATIYGDGQCSILKLMGGDYNSSGDTHMIRAQNCHGVTIRDLQIDGSRDLVVSANEQMHGIYVRDSSEILIDRCRLFHMRGDGVYSIGVNSNSEKNIIRNSVFLDNGRSGIAIQYHSRQTIIQGNFFELNSDQDIDMEFSGTGGEDILVDSNIIKHSTTALAMAPAGQSLAVPLKNVIITRNVITGGGVMLARLSNAKFTHNIIQNAVAQRALDLLGCVDTLVADNWIEGSTAPEVVHLGTNNSRVQIKNNDIVQKAAGSGIYSESAGSENTFDDNRIVGLGTSGAGIHIRNTTNDLVTRYGIIVRGNKITKFTNGIQVSTANASTGFDGFQLEGNFVHECGKGYLFETGTGIDFIKHFWFDNRGIGHGVTQNVSNLGGAIWT